MLSVSVSAELKNLTSYIYCFLQIGAFHTLEIELQRPFVLRKVIVIIPVITSRACNLDLLLEYLILVRIVEVVLKSSIEIWGGSANFFFLFEELCYWRLSFAFCRMSGILMLWRYSSRPLVCYLLHDKSASFIIDDANNNMCSWNHGKSWNCYFKWYLQSCTHLLIYLFK